MIKRMSNKMATHNTIMIVIRFSSQKVGSVVGIEVVEFEVTEVIEVESELVDVVVDVTIDPVGINVSVVVVRVVVSEVVALLFCISTCLFLTFGLKCIS